MLNVRLIEVYFSIRWARMAYIVPPYVAATVSFLCAIEALGNMSAEKVIKNDTILLTKLE